MSDKDHYLKQELDSLAKTHSDIILFFESGFNDGLWYWDLENPENEWMSPRFWELLGFDPNSKKHLVSEWQDLIFPEDLEKALENFNKHCADENFPYDQIVRYRHRNGSTVWVRCRGLAVRDDSGKPIRLMGAHTDLTALKEAQQAVIESEFKLRSFVNSTDDLITQVDASGNFTFLSPSCRKYFGLTAEDCLNRPALDFVHPDDRQSTEEAFAKWVASAETSFSYVNRQINVSGDVYTMLWTINVIRDDDGKIISFNSIARDVTETEQRKAILARSEALLREVESLADVGGWELDLRDNSIYWTRQVYEIHELPIEKNISTPLKMPFAMNFYSQHSQAELEQAMAKLIENGENYDLELQLTTAKGNPIWVRTKGRAVYENGDIVKLTGSIQNISERKRIESYLRETQSLLKKRLSRESVEKKAALHELKLAAEVFKNSLEGIVITNTDSIIIDINQAFTEITGYSRDEAIGQHTRTLRSDRHDEAFYKMIWNTLNTEGAWAGEVWNMRKSGEPYILRLSISAVTGIDGKATHYVAVFRDITEMKESEEHILHQATHDALTGLPNRTLLKDRLDVAFSHAKRSGNKVALLFIDLDNFKKVNDSLGHAHGDHLLRECAKRLKKILREEDTIARMGGDEFLIMMENIHSTEEVVHLSQRITQQMSESFSIDGDDIVVTSSIGIALHPQDGTDPDTLIRNADMAMYRAKQSGKNSYQLFTSSMHQEVRHKLSLENSLRKAIENNEMEVYYQPKIETGTQRVYGLEALVRWVKPDGQIISPAEFIPLAENVGLIHPLGEQVLEKACNFTRKLKREGYNLQISVNLSLNQFQQSRLAENVLSTISKAKIDPQSLELEITESAIMKDIEKTINQLNDLSEAGVSLSVDDFGTGYSSLSYLKELPLDVLKIDQSFIRGLPESAEDMKIVTAIQSLAKSFEMKTVAEGVETLEQYRQLKSLGCDAIQGFLFSKPIPEAKVTDFLNSHQPLKII